MKYEYLTPVESAAAVGFTPEQFERHAGRYIFPVVINGARYYRERDVIGSFEGCKIVGVDPFGGERARG